MSLHNKVERFLSSAEILLFQKIDNNIILGLHFNKSQFDTFRDIDNYKRLNKYFNGRKITLAIIETDAYYRASLIDKETGDTVNINNVNFVTGNLEGFVNSIDTNKEIPFFIYGYTKDGTTKVMQPILPDSAPIIIQGYSFVNKK